MLAGSSVQLKVRVYDSAEGFEELQPEWNRLLHRSPTDTVFLTWEWQSLWWRAYHPGDLLLTTVRDDSGRLVGIGPWFIEHNDAGERVVRGIGCVDVTDYVDMIAEPEYFDAVTDALAAMLAENAAKFDRINLCNLRENSPSLEYLRLALDRAGFETEIADQEVCPVIPLGKTFEQYIEGLDKKNRHELRRKLRHAAGTPDLAWRIVGQHEYLNSCTDLFLSLMAESTEQKAAFLKDEQNVAFFRSILPAMMANGWLQLAFLTIGGEPTAAYVNFVYNRRVLVYNSGLKLTHSNLSPGIILLIYLIQHACESGCTAFDFLRGDEEYKYRLGGKDEPLFMLKAKMN